MDTFLAVGLIEDHIVPKINYWIYIILMMMGLYAMIAKNNLIKKLIGMSIFQTAIILFYVSIGVKSESGIPIISEQLQQEISEVKKHNKKHPEEKMEYPEIDAAQYANPLPHVLMLTAIVVGVSTLGLALAISQKIYAEFGTVEEDEILAQIKTRGIPDDD